MFLNVSSKGRAVLITAVVAWIGVVAISGFFASDETVIEQASHGQGKRDVQEAVTSGVEALAGQPYAYTVAPPMNRLCDITPIRSGVHYQQHLDVVTETGDSDLVIDRLHSHLSDRYELTIAPGDGARGTTEDFIDLTLSRDETVRWHADAGCRRAELSSEPFSLIDREDVNDNHKVIGTMTPIAEPIGEISIMRQGSISCPESAPKANTHTYWAELDSVDTEDALADFRDHIPEEASVLVDTDSSVAYQTQAGDFVIAQEGQVLSEEEAGATLAYTTPCGPVS